VGLHIECESAVFFRRGLPVVILTGCLILGLMLIHLYAGKLRFLQGVPRSRWLSAASGVSVAYVFVHVFPELAKAQETLRAAVESLRFLEHHAYLAALFGMALFYGLEQMVKTSQARCGEKRSQGGESTVEPGVFWLHIGSFAIYNALIGYLLLHREEQDLRGLFFFATAMGFHFLVNDYGLREDHRDTYHRVGRWILAAAVAAGWLLGLWTTLNRAALALLFAFLAGGVVLNVLKEELPEERQSRFWPFAAGAAGYAALLLTI
jgi:zinc transporter ZupT